jgi:hypothetical protein
VAKKMANPAPVLIGSLATERADERALTVVELAGFAKDAKAILTEEELDELKQDAAIFRQLGPIIKGTGGLRKFRYGAKEKGKRAGVRIIYYYGGDHMPVFLLAIHGKSEKLDITEPEKKAMRKLVAALDEENRIKTHPVTLRVLDGTGRKRR